MAGQNDLSPQLAQLAVALSTLGWIQASQLAMHSSLSIGNAFKLVCWKCVQASMARGKLAAGAFSRHRLPHQSCLSCLGWPVPLLRASQTAFTNGLPCSTGLGQCKDVLHVWDHVNHQNGRLMSAVPCMRLMHKDGLWALISYPMALQSEATSGRSSRRHNHSGWHSHIGVG